jgi:hypothetical protein
MTLRVAVKTMRYRSRGVAVVVVNGGRDYRISEGKPSIGKNERAGRQNDQCECLCGKQV